MSLHQLRADNLLKQIASLLSWIKVNLYIPHPCGHSRAFIICSQHSPPSPNAHSLATEYMVSDIQMTASVSSQSLISISDPSLWLVTYAGGQRGMTATKRAKVAFDVQGMVNSLTSTSQCCVNQDGSNQ